MSKLTLEEKKKRVKQDLVALEQLDTPNAKQALIEVDHRTYDRVIEEFSGGRLEQLTDLILDLEAM